MQNSTQTVYPADLSGNPAGFGGNSVNTSRLILHISTRDEGLGVRKTDEYVQKTLGVPVFFSPRSHKTIKVHEVK